MGASVRLRLKDASDRGQATHIAMTLLKADYGNVIRLASTKRLPGLMLHKAENMIDRVRRRHTALDRNFVRAIDHHRWASLCCRHMAEFLERMGVTEIVAIEQRLPPVRVFDVQGHAKLVDTGEMDIIGFSPTLGGLVAIEIKNRTMTDVCEVAWGKAWRNAAGVTLLAGRNGWPPLKEMVWVFYTPHPKNLHIPLANEKVLDYGHDRVWDYFVEVQGGKPFLPFLL